MAKIASHPATVVQTRPGVVTVQMRVYSACSSCEGHAHCGFAEAKNKTADIETRQWQQFRPGDSVTVTIKSSNGLKAVFLAYILPGLLLLASFTTLHLLHVGDGATALATLAVLAAYGMMLYLCRHRLQKRFSFQISR